MSTLGCARTGLCCEYVLLDFSPRQLRESYVAWKNRKKQMIRLADIDMIWPMLASRCRGKFTSRGARAGDPKYTKYVYGPCKHFRRVRQDGTLVGECTIHAHRPALCSGYPYYEENRAARMSDGPPPANPGYMRGCGFNPDSRAGHSTEDFSPAKLRALRKDEQ